MWPRIINIGKAIAKFDSLTKAAELAETMSGKVTIIGVTIHQIKFQSTTPVQIKLADGEAQRLGIPTLNVKKNSKIRVHNIPKEITEVYSKFNL